MKVVIVEFPWQAEKISSNKLYKNDVIISVDPESSYIFKKGNYKYYEGYQFCDHESLWRKYKNITDISLNITKILDKYLWKVDPKFKELNWNFFNDYHYILKTSYDMIYYYIELMTNVIERFHPQEIIVASSDDFKLDHNLLIDDLSMLRLF